VTQLLVSVRSSLEARAALAGGASLLDVKEPRRGSLGPADPATIRDVVRAVSGSCPVSAALGELLDSKGQYHLGTQYFLDGLAYAKWGLAGCADQGDWPCLLARVARQIRTLNPGCQPVAVAYADWRRARSPCPEAVLHFIHKQQWTALLVDTWQKDGTNLLDWLPPEELLGLREHCREMGIGLALAGSLGWAEIAALLPLKPEWFAVRGAVCRNRRREAEINARAVRRLADLLRAAVKAASAGN